MHPACPRFLQSTCQFSALMTGEGLLCRLAARGQEEVLQAVFLLLEPRDLKACRCLSRGWNSFILERLWGSRGGRRRLETRARQMWRSSKATVMELGKAHSQVHRAYGSLFLQDLWINLLNQ